MKKRPYYVRMEAVGYFDFVVLASSKEEAGKVAQENSYKARCHCEGFETGEISRTPISGFEPERMPTEEEPVVPYE